MIARVNRLRKSREVQKVLHRGTRYHTACLRMTFLPNRARKPRFTVVISTKTAKLSTVRNRLKRQIRVTLNQFVREHPALSLDIVINITRLPQNGQLLTDQCAELLARVSNIQSEK